jgi:hypothetical protein
VQHTTTLKSHVNLKKDSLVLKTLESGKVALAFKLDCSQPCEVRRP